MDIATMGIICDQVGPKPRWRLKHVWNQQFEIKSEPGQNPKKTEKNKQRKKKMKHIKYQKPTNYRNVFAKHISNPEKKGFFWVKPFQWSSRMSQRIGMPHRIAEMHPQSCITLTSNWWHGASNINIETNGDDDDGDDDDDHHHQAHYFDILESKNTQIGRTKSNQNLLYKKCMPSIRGICKIEAIANPFPSRKLVFRKNLPTILPNDGFS